ncbi:MAG: hypothetical protein Q8Q23_00120 [bacterium]|nr:hypothetical protein [bacterium]
MKEQKSRFLNCGSPVAAMMGFMNVDTEIIKLKKSLLIKKFIPRGRMAEVGIDNFNVYIEDDGNFLHIENKNDPEDHEEISLMLCSHSLNKKPKLVEYDEEKEELLIILEYSP